MASLALLVVQGTLPLLSLYFMKLVVDTVTTGLAAPNKGVAFGQVALLIGLMGVVTLVGALCRSMAGLVSEAQAQVVTDHVSDILHAKSIEVDLEYYESSQYYDTLHRAQQEAPYRPTRIVNGLAQVGQNGVSLLAMAGLLFSFHWGVAAILFAAVVPGVLVRLRYAGKMYRWQRQRTPAERQAWYFHWLLTGDVHAKEVRLFDLGSLFMRRFRDLRQQLRRERLEITTRRSLAELVTQASATLAVFGSYAFITYRTVQGTITLGDLVMYYQAFQRGQGFLQEMLGGLAGLYEDNLFLSNLYEFLDLKPKVVEPHHPRPVPQPMQTGIVFDHVSFQYPTGTRKVLEDITLTIRPGEHVALVGENGAGKTTLIKLLCRLYDPTEGTITFDGFDLRQFATAALRREISVIFQDYARYHLTARENIWFGDVDLPPDDERIVAAARHSGADGVITGLPQGYETTLGKWFEDGEELSIGEWQKVALARAFLRAAQIIVLDEPTSALDAQAEYEVFKKFRQLAEGRTAILISHRFSTVRLADHIYVLDNGRISESGTHDELVRRGGMYARLFETQAQYYR
jgi:ATP-binding cassette subfamily B protein